jgi:hypothetical protein
MKIAKRRVPWFTPPHLLRRRQLVARLKRKGTLPSPPAKAPLASDPELTQWAKRQTGER